MTQIPDFSTLSLVSSGASTPPADVKATANDVWTTPEGIDVKPVFTGADIEGLDFLNSYPGIAPYLRGPYPAIYVRQTWTIRQ